MGLPGGGYNEGRLGFKAKAEMFARLSGKRLTIIMTECITLYKD